MIVPRRAVSKIGRRCRARFRFSCDFLVCFLELFLPHEGCDGVSRILHNISHLIAKDSTETVCRAIGQQSVRRVVRESRPQGARCSLELLTQVEARAAGLEILLAETGVEAASAEDEIFVQLVADPEIDPAPEPQTRRPALLAGGPHREGGRSRKAAPSQISRSSRGFQKGRNSSIFGQRFITTLRPAFSASFAASSSYTPICPHRTFAPIAIACSAKL